MGKINVGIIGLGSRGLVLLKQCILPREDVSVIAICDLYEDNLQKAAEAVRDAGRSEPFCTKDYREAIFRPGLDAILVTCAWVPHIEIACAAMKAGKYVAVEVGGAYSIEDCWKLVRTHEETGTHCMLLENCCYGRYEMMILNMIQQNVFGEIVHCQGGYLHDLRRVLANVSRHYRPLDYILRNCENYPTHELGPIAQFLDINRGNRMLKLNSVASKAAGLHEYIKQEHINADRRFAQGDVVTTLINVA